MTSTIHFNLDGFAGSIAGREGYTSFRGGHTYSRILDEQVLQASCVHELRACICSPWDRTAAHGTDQTIGNASGYPWRWISRCMEDDVFFKILETSNDDRRAHLSSHQYALERMGNPLEEICGLPIKKIQHQCKRYGIDYFVNRFFDGVEQPEEGDLVVYYVQGKPFHSGIFQSNKPNEKRIGTVESKWDQGDFPTPFAFLHDIFFLPPHCGNIAKFYRLKKAANPSPALPKHNEAHGPMHILTADKTFRYIANEANDKIRAILRKYPFEPLRVIAELPQIACLDEIAFSGTCHTYALDKIFGPEMDKLPMDITDADLFGKEDSKLLQKYFTPTVHPQAGDLAVYSNSSDSKHVHFGVYIADDLIESKWGMREVYRHPPFYTDKNYGDTLTYYRLNPQTSASLFS